MLQPSRKPGLCGRRRENYPCPPCYRNADYDISRAEKKGKLSISMNWTKIPAEIRNSFPSPATVSGEGVQQALLKILEGTKGHVPPKGWEKAPSTGLYEIDKPPISSSLPAGAFFGLEKIIPGKAVPQRPSALDVKLAEKTVESNIFDHTNSSDFAQVRSDYLS